MTDLQTIIPAGVDSFSFHQALALRVLAEEGADPDKYERAANAFMAVGMTASAKACQKRATYYRSLQ